MSEEGRWIIWPSRQFVTTKRLISWAQDAITNGEVSEMYKNLEVKTLNDAIDVLNDSGQVTFSNQPEPPALMWED